MFLAFHLHSSFFPPLPEDSLSIPSQHAAHIHYGWDGNSVVCTHLTLYQILYSRFNARVFNTSGLAFPLPSSLVCRNRRIKIVSYLILSPDRMMSLLYAFYSTSPAFFSSLRSMRYSKSHRLPSFQQNDEQKWNYIRLEGGWQLCEINDGIIRLLQQKRQNKR